MTLIGRDGELVYESPSLVRRWGPAPPGYRAWDTMISAVFTRRTADCTRKTVRWRLAIVACSMTRVEANEITHRAGCIG